MKTKTNQVLTSLNPLTFKYILIRLDFYLSPQIAYAVAYNNVSFHMNNIILIRLLFDTVDSCFVPPIVYTIFGSSRHLAVGTIASASLLIYQTISTVVRPEDDPKLYLHLVFTTTFVAGAFEASLGILR